MAINKPSDERIEDLRQILERQTGKEVSTEEAQDAAYRLLRLYDVLREGVASGDLPLPGDLPKDPRIEP